MLCVHVMCVCKVRKQSALEMGTIGAHIGRVHVYVRVLCAYVNVRMQCLHEMCASRVHTMCAQANSAHEQCTNKMHI